MNIVVIGMFFGTNFFFLCSMITTHGDGSLRTGCSLGQVGSRAEEIHDDCLFEMIIILLLSSGCMREQQILLWLLYCQKHPLFCFNKVAFGTTSDA